jgi:uncharacterized protein YaiE (UPF0345 family)
MINVNTYFEGNVKSLSFENKAGKFTTGVMMPGNYEFGTGSPEIMTVSSGALKVLLPGETEWKLFEKGASFDVPGNSKFNLIVEEATAYVCQFV